MDLPIVAALDREVAEGAQAWLQYDVAIAPGGRAECYRRLAVLARTMVTAGPAADFFYMHKAPGLRLRFRVPERRTTADTTVRDALREWAAAGAVSRWSPAVYEPETLLFGGPASMAVVHRLFTADSLAWLAYLAGGGEDTAALGSAWAFSFLLLRPLFQAAGVTDIEDLDVWDRLRWQTGRRFPVGGPTVPDGLRELAADLRFAWTHPADSPAATSTLLRPVLDEYGETVRTAGRDWLAGYFHTDAALIGPRAALAYVVIFHWNRGALPFRRQQQITEAMALHPAGDGA
jgi:thiopeptide-type bacteriocin biosynthesis protein